MCGFIVLFIGATVAWPGSQARSFTPANNMYVHPPNRNILTASNTLKTLLYAVSDQSNVKLA